MSTYILLLMSSVREFFKGREDFKVQICEGEILENEFYCRLILRQVFSGR